jgi:hypothetical protein
VKTEMLRENGKGNPARVSTLASQKLNLKFRKGDTMETVKSIYDLAAAALEGHRPDRLLTDTMPGLRFGSGLHLTVIILML